VNQCLGKAKVIENHQQFEAYIEKQIFCATQLLREEDFLTVSELFSKIQSCTALYLYTIIKFGST